MVVLQKDWADVVADGFDPTRHPEATTLEAAQAMAETERAQALRERLFVEDRWQENYGERSEKKRDGDDLIFEEVVVGRLFEYSDATLAEFDTFKRKWDRESKILDEILRKSLAEAQEALEQAEKELEDMKLNGFLLSNGRRAYYDEKNDVFTDQHGQPLEAEEADEARQRFESAKSKVDDENRNLQRLKDQLERQEALKTRWKELEDLKGKIPESEFKRRLAEFERDYNTHLEVLSPREKAKFEQRMADEGYSNNATVSAGISQQNLEETATQNDRIQGEEAAQPEQSLTDFLSTDLFEADFSSEDDVVAGGDIQTEFSACSCFNPAARNELPPLPTPDSLASADITESQVTKRSLSSAEP